MTSLKDKVTLITGASSGIGAATAVLFAKLGAQLALNGRDVENLKKIAGQCTECGAPQVCFIVFHHNVWFGAFHYFTPLPFNGATGPGQTKSTLPPSIQRRGFLFPLSRLMLKPAYHNLLYSHSSAVFFAENICMILCC